MGNISIFNPTNYNLSNALSVRKYFESKKHPLKNFIDSFGVDFYIHKENYAQAFPKVPESILIKHGPIAVTKNNELVCLPKFKQDPPSIFIAGTRGEGKGLLSHRIIDYFYWKDKFYIVSLNDYNTETQHWASSMHSYAFVSKLALLYETPRPLPIAMCVPFIDENSKQIKILKNVPKIYINLDFQDFINNMNQFVDLGGSKAYFTNLDFSNVTSIDEFLEVLTQLPLMDDKGKKKESMLNVKNKIVNYVMMFVNEGLISFKQDRITKIRYAIEEDMVSEITGKGDRKINDYVEDIFSTLFKYGAIPSLVTEQITQKEWFGDYLKVIMDKIKLDYRTKIIHGKMKPLIFYIDEMSKISSLEKPTKAVNTIKEIVVQGRMLNLGSIINAQNITQIDKAITSNSKYKFTFRPPTEEDAREFLKQSGLSKRKENIKKLMDLKKWEFFGTTNDVEFQVYDVYGNKRKTTNEFVGILIPPLSFHSTPNQTTLTKTRDYIKSWWLIKLRNEKNIKFKYPFLSKELFRFDDTAPRNPKEKYDIKEFTSPRLVEHLNLEKAYYGTSRKARLVDYSYVKSKDIFIYHLNKMKEFEYVLKHGYHPTSNAIPITELKNDMSLLYHPGKNEISLIGKGCSKIPIRVN